MAIRRVEVLCPAPLATHVERIVRGCEPLEVWTQTDETSSEVRALFENSRVEGVLDALAAFMDLNEGVQVVVLDVKAALPRIEESPQPVPLPALGDKAPRARISRDELASEMAKGTELRPVYVITVVLSTIVAAIGLLRNSPAIVIGAMVIAPLMGPNMGLALATTLGDGALARRALLTSVVGLATAVLATAAITVFLDPIDLRTPEIAARIQPHWSDVVLAIASGTAGALAYTTGVSSSLVGVMVAVALLPPTVVATLLAVQGQPEAVNAALLLATNVIGVILAGVATFSAQGIRPRTWWDAQRTRRHTIWALSFLTVLLVVFTILVILRQSAVA